MAEQYCFIKVLEQSHVSPPPASVPATSLPLTFFDIVWLPSCHMQRLFFYEFPFPTSHFMKNSVSNLKNSLSLTLQHFFPFAGKLSLPPLPQRPYIYYTDGDSLPFIVTESTLEFKHLIGNHTPRIGQELECLVPKLPPPSVCSDIGDGFYKQQPLMTIQVTVFPNVGISIGITFCHFAADGKAFGHFTKSWASICMAQTGDLTFVKNFPPDYISAGIWSKTLEEFGPFFSRK